MLVEAAATQADFFEVVYPQLHRMVEIKALLIAQLRLLTTLGPEQFMAMHLLLGTASGSQSLQFTLIEAARGALDTPRAELLTACQQPSLYDRMVQALVTEWQRRCATPEAQTFKTQWIAALRECSGLLHDVGSGPVTPEMAFDKYRGFAQLPLAAALTALQVRQRATPRDRLIDDGLAALCQLKMHLLSWRQVHAEFVRDLLDGLPGTGGSDGYRCLTANAAAQPHSALRSLLSWPAARAAPNTFHLWPR